jgi:hypothetical protein
MPKEGLKIPVPGCRNAASGSIKATYYRDLQTATVSLK